MKKAKKRTSKQKALYLHRKCRRLHTHWKSPAASTTKASDNSAV